MPQLDPSVFATQLFWLALTFIPLYIVLWKVALPRVTDVRAARRERVEDDLEKAEALRAEADAALAEYEAALADATARAQAAIRGAASEVAEESVKQRDALAEKLAAEAAEAERRIAEETQRVIADIGTMATDLAQAASSRLVGGTVSQDDAKAAVDAVLQGDR